MTDAEFALAFEEVRPILVRFLRERESDADLVEDVVQDAMMKAWERRELYDPSKSSFSTWLTTILIRCHVDRLRKEQKERPPEPALAYKEGASTGARDDLFDYGADQEFDEHLMILRVLVEEAPTSHQIIYDHIAQGGRQADLADHFGVSEGTMSRHVKKALDEAGGLFPEISPEPCKKSESQRITPDQPTRSTE